MHCAEALPHLKAIGIDICDAMLDGLETRLRALEHAGTCPTCNVRYFVERAKNNSIKACNWRLHFWP